MSVFGCEKSVVALRRYCSILFTKVVITDFHSGLEGTRWLERRIRARPDSDSESVMRAFVVTVS